MADIIYTRNRKQYEAAVEELRRKDLAAAKKKYRAQQVLARKAAAAKNEKYLVDAKTARANSGTRKKSTVTQAPQRHWVEYKAAVAKRKAQAQAKKKKKKKPKKRSVWTLSGGAFESNRQRH